MDKVHNLVIFDCDGTLTVTKSGATFRENAGCDFAWAEDFFGKEH